MTIPPYHDPFAEIENCCIADWKHLLISDPALLPAATSSVIRGWDEIPDEIGRAHV